MKTFILILFKLIFIHFFNFFLSDFKTVKCVSSYSKALKHTDSVFLHLIFKWDNKVVINIGYRYGCELHSILQFLLDFLPIH